MGVKDAVRSRDGVVLLDVTVMPSADRSVFPTGYNEWRGRLEARVEQPARDGRANEALCELVAQRLGLDARQVGVHRGHTSRRKTLAVQGVSAGEVHAFLENVIEP